MAIFDTYLHPWTGSENFTDDEEFTSDEVSIGTDVLAYHVYVQLRLVPDTTPDSDGEVDFAIIPRRSTQDYTDISPSYTLTLNTTGTKFFRFRFGDTLPNNFKVYIKNRTGTTLSAATITVFFRKIGNDFNPNLTGTIYGWWRPHLLTAFNHGDPVQNLPDFSPGGHDGIQLTGSNQPIWRDNQVNDFLGSLEYQSGTARWFEVNGETNILNGSGDLSVVSALFLPSDMVTERTILGQSGEARFFTGSDKLNFENMGGGVQTSTDIGSLSSWHVVAMRRKGTGAGDTELYLNGTQINGTGVAVAGFSTGQGYIGYEDTTADNWWDEMGETAIWHSALTDNEMSEAMNYFMNVHNLS